jgi:predicted ATPase
MIYSKHISFEEFTLDPVNELLWKGSERIRLRPKTFALLRHLIEHPGRLFSKKELMNGIWQNCNVGDEALKHCIAEIRKVLNDDTATPRFIETVYRRGYRFIGKTSSQKNGKNQAKPYRESNACDGKLVGRTLELAQLQDLLEKATTGSRQVVFIGGPQRIGKTSLVDEFLKTINHEHPSRKNGKNNQQSLIIRGQCIKLHAAVERYLPFLEAFTTLDSLADRKSFATLLRRHAPRWLSQIPSLAGMAQLQNLQRFTHSTTPENMMREMAEAIDALAAERLVVLVLEDLHWSDSSTVDLISYLAQRRSKGGFLLIGTYRSGCATARNDHLLTVKQELIENNHCHELSIPPLDEDAVREYLRSRFYCHNFPKEFARLIMQKSCGNPQLMIDLIDGWKAQNLITLHDEHWVLDSSLENAALLVPITQ